MRRRPLVAFMLAVLASAGTVAAEDLSDYCTPYGFRLPSLQKGEYVLTVSGNYYKLETERTNYQTPPALTESSYKDYGASLQAVYAVNNQLLVRGRLQFYPSQTVGDYRFSSPVSTEPIFQKQNQKAYVRPNFTLVFRPASSLEVYSDFTFSSTAVEYEYEGPAKAVSEKERKTKLRGFSFGVAYLGKL